MAKKALKSCNTEQIDLVIKRLPYAKVMAIRRQQTGENLGLQRLGGTAEVIIFILIVQNTFSQSEVMLH